MLYLMGEILGALAVAALIGFVAGWSARGAALRGNALDGAPRAGGEETQEAQPGAEPAKPARSARGVRRVRRRRRPAEAKPEPPAEPSSEEPASD